MKKVIGWIMIILGGLFCWDGVMCIPVAFTADIPTWGERLFLLVCFLALAVFNGFLCRLGFRLKAEGRNRKGCCEKPNEREQTKVAYAPGRENRSKESKTEYKPVIDRPGVVSDGRFVYRWRRKDDLFPNGKEGLAYPELQWDFQIAANLGRHLLDLGGQITRISIGGGSTEVSHTGSVAYGHTYGTLESFVATCMDDLEEAEQEASLEYGGWFSSLSYEYIVMFATIKEAEIRVSVTGWTVEVSIVLENSSAGFSYLVELVKRFGNEDSNQKVGADRIFWDAEQKIFRRTYQLEETKTWFFSSYMNEKGEFVRCSLDGSAGENAHYDIPPEKLKQLVQMLKKEMPQERYLPNPAVGFAAYLQYYEAAELIELLKRHDMIRLATKEVEDEATSSLYPR